MSIELEMTFDAGHRIVGHKGKCARLHGHTYRVKIVCIGEIKDPGFIVDFGDLKDLVNGWDHFMLLWDEDPIISRLQTQDGVALLPFNPTAENMAQNLAERIYKKFGLDYVHVTLWETPNASASAYVGLKDG